MMVTATTLSEAPPSLVADVELMPIASTAWNTCPSAVPLTVAGAGSDDPHAIAPVLMAKTTATPAVIR
ncbi:MAG: hypothetical protein FWD17_14355, partial [Polyangiaceae bacterium]|nr:hypothetical protein [Polyangiaceae bacterium]